MSNKSTLSSEVRAKFDAYPKHVRPVMMRLRALILGVAADESIVDLSETLKWNEPAYVCRQGSTVRIDWKVATPDRIFLYFNCNSRLVETFRELQLTALSFVGKRAIALHLDQPLPECEIATCVSLALRYHRVKHLPLLGA